MTLDNDLLDLWLMAGMVGGLDEPTAKRLLEELQAMRDEANEEAAGFVRAMEAPMERHVAAVETVEELSVKAKELGEQLGAFLSDIRTIGDDLFQAMEIAK
ncbi:hypothetical protein GAY33_01365 [Azospirillum brasilense]|uniref:hypothetical protein n=1 Tax=Azospirillum argentinense TaxID=2970906 RepID=UPI00190E2F57|nr:hypothetical protein [Azospirillum argentinense]MBK3797903.1 hypothetical protein [Azospirillum argentinense]